MPEIPSKQDKEYVNFLCDLSIWRGSFENGAWAPWKKPNGESVNYKRYRDTLQKFTLLQSKLPPLTPRRVLIRDKKIVTNVRELRNLSDSLADQACRLIEEDKTYLFNPLVHVTILFHIRNHDFLESLSEAVKHKSKAATHGNKKYLLVLSAAAVLSRAPGAKPSDIYKVLAKILDKEPLFRLLLRDKDLHLHSFQKFFKRNKADILALRDRLTADPT